MADQKTREQAEQRLTRALEETGAGDPRVPFRERLRSLRESDERAFQKALDYYENRLVPAVAADGSDPLGEWLDYGRFLANLAVSGRTVQIDPTGRSRPYERPVALDRLVLHLPTSQRERALPVRIPSRPSPAQLATLRLLAGGEDGAEGAA